MVESKIRSFEDFFSALNTLESRIDDYAERISDLNPKTPGYDNIVYHYRSRVDHFEDRILELMRSYPKYTKKLELSQVENILCT